MGQPKNSDWDRREIIILSFLILVFGSFVILQVSHSQDTRPHPFAIGCISNLRQIDDAANQFASENHLTNGDRINFPTDLTPYIKLNPEGKIPPCPQGGVYHIGKVGKTPTCSLGETVTPAHVLP